MHEAEKFHSRFKHEHRNKSFPDFLGGLVFISAGVILILNNFGVLPWVIWRYIIIYWPVIFILIGLDLISQHSLFLKFATTLIGAAIIAFVFIYSLSAADPNFRLFVFNKYPFWQEIYRIIPNSPDINLNPSPDNSFHYQWRDGFYYSN